MAQSQGWKGSLRWKVGAGSWAEETAVKDVDPGYGGDTIEQTTRAHAGYRSFQQGLKDIAPTVTIPWDTANTFCAACSTAFRDGSSITLAVLDAAADGFSGDFVVESIDVPQPLDGAIEATISFKYSGTGAPTWVTSAPT